MDRKTFLKYSGLILVGLTGFKTVLNLLTQTDPKTLASKDVAKTRGFGGGKYGA